MGGNMHNGVVVGQRLYRCEMPAALAERLTGPDGPLAESASHHAGTLVLELDPGGGGVILNEQALKLLRWLVAGSDWRVEDVPAIRVGGSLYPLTEV